jgi:hypothetical protein
MLSKLLYVQVGYRDAVNWKSQLPRTKELLVRQPWTCKFLRQILNRLRIDSSHSPRATYVSDPGMTN